MRLCAALLADAAVHNAARDLALGLHRTGWPLETARLPAHITVKMPYEARGDLEAHLELWRGLAADTVPLDFTLTAALDWQENGACIVVLHVLEQDSLRVVHGEANRRLGERFEGTAAPHDGAEFHFHLTVATGGPRPAALDLPRPLRGTARELVVFAQPDEEGPWITLRRFALGAAAGQG